MITMKRWHFYAALLTAVLTCQLILPLAWRAMAQERTVHLDSGHIPDVTMAAGVGPDGKMAQIRVDGDGHVICSKD